MGITRRAGEVCNNQEMVHAMMAGRELRVEENEPAMTAGWPMLPEAIGRVEGGRRG